MGHLRERAREAMSMTAKKDLKKRVRTRQAHTGESYTTALGQVLARRPPAEGILVELTELTEEAARLGLHVRRAFASPPVIQQVDGPSALAQLRDALSATEEDTDTALLRSVLLAGQRPTPPAPPSPRALHELRRFVARAQAGIGGTNQLGTMLALHVRGRRDRLLVIYALRLAPDPLPDFLAHSAARMDERFPALFLATPDRTPDHLFGTQGFLTWF
jgi:hypothetical protein